MVSYSEETLDITLDIVILPGFSEGLSQRGAWFAHTPEIKTLLKQLKPGKSYVLRYTVHEPDSETPLSDGEIDHLLNSITTSIDQYRSILERLELQYKDIRKRGKLNALIYILGILTVRWYWWIFLTRGEMSFNNSLNGKHRDGAVKTWNIITRFWEKGKNSSFKVVLNRTVSDYKKLPGDPLNKYRLLRDEALSQSRVTDIPEEERKAWKRVAQAYRAIISKMTGRSMVTKMLPTNFGERVIYFFQRSYKIPEPDSIFPVRNLEMKIQAPPVLEKIKDRNIAGRNRINGNKTELYLLATRQGEPVCVPSRGANPMGETLARSEIIRRTHENLEVVLHVGTGEELNNLLGLGEQSRMTMEKKTALHSRLQNAFLDTNRQSEAITAYYLKEYLPVMYRNFQVHYPFRSRLHSLFPWLFITNGIPVASILAGVWLFIDPYYTSKFQKEYNKYFSGILDSVDWAYHNIEIHVKVNNSLGWINNIIRNKENPSPYRDLAGELGKLALPVSVIDRIILNNLTGETRQLNDFRREANNFTSLPLYFFRDGEAGMADYRDLPGEEMI